MHLVSWSNVVLVLIIICTYLLILLLLYLFKYELYRVVFNFGMNFLVLVVVFAGILFQIYCVVDEITLLNVLPFLIWILFAIILWFSWISQFIVKTFKNWYNGNSIDSNFLILDNLDSNVNIPESLTLKQINKINELNQNEINSNDKCSICLDNLSNNKKCKKLPQCKHILHSKCIDQWLGIRGDCPVCRGVVDISVN
eukprot:313951_1